MEKPKVIVLGAGLIGGVIARDLAQQGIAQITLADINAGALARAKSQAALETRQFDLSDEKELRTLVANFSMVVSAVPGWLGYRTSRTVLECGKPLVDIAFFPEDPAPLDAIARTNGVFAVLDIGVAPGLSNLLAARAAQEFDELQSVTIYVGGLPRVRSWPYEYKAVFSPADVIEEYTRPARIRRGGENVTVSALTEPEFLDFAEVGTLEAFITDGLRSLLHTLPAPTMIEKTMRYPGHRALMEVFREGGFFGTDAIKVGAQSVVPRELTSKLMFDSWQLAPGEEDFTALRVVVEGKVRGTSHQITYNLLDRYDNQTQTTSMARTTGYTASEVARLVLSGELKGEGILYPEDLVKIPGVFETLLERLSIRGVQVHLTEGPTR